MLENTFIHIQGIGPKREQSLWKKDIVSWYHFLDYKGTVFSPRQDTYIREELRLSIEHLSDVSFFNKRLSSAHMWRLFEAFKDKAAYLDIETSGGYQGTDEITVIGLYDGNGVRTFINGRNLDEFEKVISSYDLIITFNGSCFDLPYLRWWFRNISLPPAHIDLCFFLKKLGYKGGLKRIEKEMGLLRDPEIEGTNGYGAILLWQEYQQGNLEALDRLVRYNCADIINLEYLMEKGYQEMKEHVMGLSAPGIPR